LDNIDTPPIGDLAETFFAALSYPGDFELVIHRKFSSSAEPEGPANFSYSLERSKLREAVGGFEEVGELKLLRMYIRSQEEELANAPVHGAEQS
jgi:hypothetical protein